MQQRTSDMDIQMELVGHERKPKPNEGGNAKILFQIVKAFHPDTRRYTQPAFKPTSKFFPVQMRKVRSQVIYSS